MAQADWYRDPTGAFEKRYWDGKAWTDHVFHAGTQATAPIQNPASMPPPDGGSPTAPPPPPGPSSTSVGASPVTAPPRPSAGSAPTDASGTVDDRYLWGIVAVPVVAGVIEMAAGFNPSLSTMLTLAAIGANIGLAQLDMRANPKLEQDESKGALTAFAALLMPVYVYKRQRTLDRSLAPFWAYLAAFIAVVGLQFSTGATNYVDAGIVEGEMESWGRSNFGVSVEVDCPGDQPARAGHRFVCEMSDGEETVGVRVEVLNSDGDIEWEVLG